jgi:hypothetical protein
MLSQMASLSWAFAIGFWLLFFLNGRRLRTGLSKTCFQEISVALLVAFFTKAWYKLWRPNVHKRCLRFFLGRFLGCRNQILYIPSGGSA